MEEDLIDSELNESPKDVILGIMRWWERKRWLFNALIIGVIIFTIITYTMEFPNRGISFRPDFFIRSLFYFIFLNICYCAGWGLKLLAYYYFKIHSKTVVLDVILFVIGSLFTSLVTYDGYRSYFVFSNYF